MSVGGWDVSQDERTAVQLVSTLVRAAKKWDADERIKKRAARAEDWLNRYNAQYPARVLRDGAMLSADQTRGD